MPYKVVFRNHVTGQFESAIMDAQYSGVKYEVGKKTFPKKGDGPLVAFDTINNAALFMQDLHIKKHLFECEVEVDEDHTEIWGEIEAGIKSSRPSFTLPQGSILCKSITLTDQIT